MCSMDLFIDFGSIFHSPPFVFWKGLREKGRGPQPEGDKSGRGPLGPSEALLDYSTGSPLGKGGHRPPRQDPRRGRRQQLRVMLGCFF